MIKTKKLVNIIVNVLEDFKMDDILIINTKRKTIYFNSMVLATGTSNRINSVIKKIQEKLKPIFGYNLSVEGEKSRKWVLIDADKVVVHLFEEEARVAYDLKSLWLK